MKEILVTGGAGYIGSITVNQLIKTGKYKVLVIDNFSTGHKKLINSKAEHYKIDLEDLDALEKFFTKNRNIDTVMHFAGFSQVGESMKHPKKYFKNNVIGGLNLLRAMEFSNCKKIIFSSSAAVYGEPKKIPIEENHPINPISPYGQSKAIFEEFLYMFEKIAGLKFLSFRYFNAGGADDKFGEIHDPETHLIPTILKKYKKGQKVKIFGNDYKTPDGTCIRDYIHVVDIANAHIKGINFLEHNHSSMINLGSEKGYSVMKILETCEKIVGEKIGFEFVKRREGDPAILTASNKKAKKFLKWTPKKDIEEIIKSAWEFEKKQKD